MRIFITGMTGTLGTALAKLHRSRGDDVWGCSRNEQKAVEWMRENHKIGTLFVGDANDLIDATTDGGRHITSMDRVYHLAAMKHVDLCEKFPGEAITENVTVTTAVASACFAVRKPLVFISTDKACLPQGVYGATKLLGEKIVTGLGGAAVRLGNLIGSSGSVFSKWKDAVSREEPIQVTDPDMTRYFIPIEDAAKFVADQFEPGKVVAPANMRAVRIGDAADRLSRSVKRIGRRPGETRHQHLIARDEGFSLDGVRYIIDGLHSSPQGISSETAERWDVDELLRVAGVKT